MHQFKGKTVMNHKLRCESVRHCRWVDSVLEDAPWVLSDGYLQKHSIDFVAHDAIPYKDTSGSASNSGDVYAHIKAKGMFLETQRTEGLSTSDIIVSVIRSYDEFVMRSLDRGYSKEELNVGASWEVRARFHEKQREFKKSLERMKGEQKLAEDAAIAFIREFNPKVTSTRITPRPHTQPQRRGTGHHSQQRAQSVCVPPTDSHHRVLLPISPSLCAVPDAASAVSREHSGLSGGAVERSSLPSAAGR